MDKEKDFSHIVNNDPGMVDVSHKVISRRQAVARTKVRMPSWLSQRLLEEGFVTNKGCIRQTAIIAGTMAVKRTPFVIPFCHSLNIDGIKITIKVTAPGELTIECFVTCLGPTGVEMEALLGASIAALSVYDMCKALTFDISIESTRLVQKTGGKSDLRETKAR